MQFAVGHSFVEGTHFHTRAFERLTNPLFQESSTDVYKRTKMATTIEQTGCWVSKNRDPPSLQHSCTFSEIVSFEKWDCVIANTTNLLQSIGHWDISIQKKRLSVWCTRVLLHLWQWNKVSEVYMTQSIFQTQWTSLCSFVLPEKCARLWLCLCPWTVRAHNVLILWEVIQSDQLVVVLSNF